MIGEYGRDPESKVQSFEAMAILRPQTAEKPWSLHALIDTVSVHTDGVTIYTEEDPSECRGGFKPAFRLIEGRMYRITVEEITPAVLTLA